MAVTIRDVAKRLNLSITTVSRALDGYDDVAEETRERVRKAAAQMGYAPSHMARQMRRQRADTIGFAISLPPSARENTNNRAFADPFVLEFIAGLGDEAAQCHLDLIVSTATPGQEEETLFRRWVQGRRVDGVVVNRLRKNDWRVGYLAQNQTPFVASGHLEGANFPYIEVDGRAGFKQLTQYLAGKGHNRIGYIGGPDGLRLQDDRQAGYRAGLRAAGLPFTKTLLAQGDMTRNGGYAAAMKLLALPQPPTAILGVNDMTAIGAMRAARERGLVVGRDVIVAGFDGIADSEHTEPPLTTLNQPAYEIARQLVQMLAELIENERVGRSHPPKQVLLQPELILRASTEGGQRNQEGD